MRGTEKGSGTALPALDERWASAGLSSPADAPLVATSCCRASDSGWGGLRSPAAAGEGEKRVGGGKRGPQTPLAVANGGALAKWLSCRSEKRGRGVSRFAEKSANSSGGGGGAAERAGAPWGTHGHGPAHEPQIPTQRGKVGGGGRGSKSPAPNPTDVISGLESAPS